MSGRLTKLGIVLTVFGLLFFIGAGYAWIKVQDGQRSLTAFSAAQNVTLQELTAAAERANVIAGGGILERQASETLIRISGQSLNLSDIEQTPVSWRTPRPVLIRDVADVRFGGPIRRGGPRRRRPCPSP